MSVFKKLGFVSSMWLTGVVMFQSVTIFLIVAYMAMTSETPVALLYRDKIGFLLHNAMLTLVAWTLLMTGSVVWKAYTSWRGKNV